MKVLKAVTMKDLPESVIDEKARICTYGYTIWKENVKDAIEEGTREIEHFKQLKEEGVCDKVEQVIEERDDDVRLLKFMEDNDLDVIFTDMEDEDVY